MANLVTIIQSTPVQNIGSRIISRYPEIVSISLSASNDWPGIGTALGHIFCFVR